MTETGKFLFQELQKINELQLELFKNPVFPETDFQISKKENNMFKFDKQSGQISVTLPEGETQGELIRQAREEIRTFVPFLYGTDVKLFGRITTGMAICLGHELAHVCKSVSIFDPKENDFCLCIWH